MNFKTEEMNFKTVISWQIWSAMFLTKLNLFYVFIFNSNDILCVKEVTVKDFTAVMMYCI